MKEPANYELSIKSEMKKIKYKDTFVLEIIITQFYGKMETRFSG